MTARPLIPLWLSLLLCACGGAGSSDPSSTSSPTTGTASANNTAYSNIATLIYSDSQRTPSGFYQETSLTFDGYVATSQLKTTDLNSAAVLRYELCSDDYAQALSWSDSINSSSGDHATLTSVQITDQYFEFDRLKLGTPNGLLRQRVFKCAYLSRNTVDLNASSGAAGTLNMRPLSAELLQSLSEYLWQFTSYNNFGNVVLSSTRASDATGLTHVLQIATLTRATGTGCDTISVANWTHHLDTSSGELQLSVTPQYSFTARETGGTVSLCN